MNGIALPALRGNDPLGFLAAMGLMVLSEEGSLPELELSWRGRSAPTAQVSGAVGSLAELTDALEAVVSDLAERKAPAPGLTSDFPVPAQGTKDPMRMSQSAMSKWYEHADARWRETDDRSFGRWLIALAAQSAVKDEKRGDVQLTPFYAPTGQMKLRSSVFDFTFAAMQAVGGPADALSRWRRSDYDGANFDDRATRDGAVTTTGKSANQGAPSPSWLATQAIRMFTIVDDGVETKTVGWQRVKMYEGFTYRSLVWPVWKPPMAPPSIRTLLAHPALQLKGDPTDPKVQRPEALRALGVSALFGASRRTRSQGDGPLGPGRSIWLST